MKNDMEGMRRRYITALISILLLLISGVCAGCSDKPDQSSDQGKAAVEASDEKAVLAMDGTELDPEDFVGEAQIGSAGGEGIHTSKWTPRSKKPWILVARAKDPATRLRIAYAMRQAVKLDQVKYSIDKKKRITLYEEAEKVGFDLPKVKAECYTSCSSVASVCLRAAGLPEETAPRLVYSDSNSEKTNLRKILKASDYFICYDTEDYTADSSKLEPGDVLFSKHHTAVVIRSENPVDI